MNYAITLHGTTYTPDGKASAGLDVTAHNARVAAEESAAWATGPDRFAGYVTFDQSTVSRPRVGERVALSTWTGAHLGSGTVSGVFRNNLTGSRIVSIRVRGTNGRTYTGRFGDEWSQLCRVRAVKG